MTGPSGIKAPGDFTKRRKKPGFFGLSHRFFLSALWRPGAKDFFFYTLALRSTVSAGIPLLSAFEIMAKSTKHHRLQQASRDINRTVSAGVPLEKAMRLHKDVFSPFFLNVFLLW